jgi:hypothetical protein
MMLNVRPKAKLTDDTKSNWTSYIVHLETAQLSGFVVDLHLHMNHYGSDRAPIHSFALIQDIRKLSLRTGLYLLARHTSAVIVVQLGTITSCHLQQCVSEVPSQRQPCHTLIEPL